MISQQIQKLINEQINVELWSAYLYLSMSLDAEHKGYSGIGNWCYVQAQEEFSHSRILQRYMISQDCDVSLTAIRDVSNNWDTPLEMFHSILNHERVITKMINEIVLQAQRLQDYATINLMMWFVAEQVEEEEQCLDLVQKFSKASDAPCYFMQIDYELKKRKYVPLNARRSKPITLREPD